ncbi:replication initiation protein RepC [Agrobacterium rosae]|uniref:Replication initiation protein RepC n=2 Tax=Agrobacterium rosae TaxID=1972867 RepID=A0A1R3U661_9HYPH|nr:replication initiation protein RepC [Agrobacterium rosae]
MQSDATPTGRRKVTMRMLNAQSAYAGSYDPTSPGKVLSAFKRASNALGIPRRLVELVDYLVGRTFAADWTGEAVMAWPSNATLCDALDLGRSQIKTLIRMGQELGLFEMRDAPNGQRYGHRAGGRITSAYGFNLTPLAVRKSEFDQIAAAHAEQRREANRLRSEIMTVRNRVLSLAQLGRESGVAGDWEGVASEAYRLASQRTGSYAPRHLSEILSKLCELHQGAIDALTPEDPVDRQAERADQTVLIPVDTDPMGPGDRPSITPTKSPSIAEANTEADGPGRPGFSQKTKPPEQKTHHLLSQENVIVKTDKRERGRESALRGFVVTTDFILRIAPTFQSWTNKAHPSWRELLEASWMVRSELGISQHAWAQACVILGQTEAVTMLAAIWARYTAGDVKSPGGLMRKMVELHERGELRLDRTLFGLADGLKGQSH